MSTGAPSERESRLLRTFVQIADTLVDDYDVTEVLHQLVVICVEVLGAAAAGMLLSDQRGHLAVVASSSERTRLLELFQLQSNEGPCLDCVNSGEPVMVADLAAERSRWPKFVAEATSEGFVSVHAVPMRLRRDTIGALNIFGHEPGEVAEQDVLAARALADIATIGILQERAIRRGEVLTEQLQTALNTRITIEQAKGVLAQAGAVEMHEAFEALRSYGRDHRTRLSDVAHQLVAGDIRPADILDSHRPSPA
jgi:transcriptional regulator with GAF, ATPase, and Fis domain